MAANESLKPCVQFDVFELDVGSYQLRRSGLPVDVPPQALRILSLLASRPNELVTRNEIKQTLWPDESYGDFDGRVNFAVKRLREALGDDAERPRYVRTERKAGYRFIAQVRLVENMPVRPAGPVAATLPPPAPPILSAEFRLGRKPVFAALVALVSVAAIGSFVLRACRTVPGVPPNTETAAVTMDDSRPEISSVTPILPQARQRIVIRGRGFGLHVPYARTDTPYLAIRNNTAYWSAGRVVPHNVDDVMLDVDRWSDDEIVISGFSGEYGAKGWTLKEGDAIEVAVWNPQSGVGPALYRTTVTSRESPK
jgi:DNA-binding winged helix-turn-helix (wHTH) protein